MAQSQHTSKRQSQVPSAMKASHGPTATPEPVEEEGVVVVPPLAELQDLGCPNSSFLHRYSREEVRLQTVIGVIFIITPRKDHAPASPECTKIIWVPYTKLVQVNPTLLTQRRREATEKRMAEDPQLAAKEEQYTCEFHGSHIVAVRRHLLDKTVSVTMEDEVDSATTYTIGPFEFRIHGTREFLVHLARHTLLTGDVNVFLERPRRRGPVPAGRAQDIEDFRRKLYRHQHPEGLRQTAGFVGRTLWGAVSNLTNAVIRPIQDLRTADTPVASPSPSPEPVDFTSPHNLRSIPKPSFPRVPRSRPSPLSMAMWKEEGSGGAFTDVSFGRLRKAAFEGSAENDVRAELWGRLLNLYKVEDGEEERKKKDAEMEKEYMIYKSQWETMTQRQRAQHSKYCQRESRIQKDVVRTDRSLQLYDGDDSKGLKCLTNILRSYCMFNWDIGYCQGMSDLASVVYYVFRDEVKAFWGLVDIMDRIGTNFMVGQKGLTRQLDGLGHLLKAIDPELEDHLKQEDPEHIFAFQWLLIWFKREYSFTEVLQVWDVILSCPTTKYYAVFIAATLLKLTRDQVLQLEHDEIIGFVQRLSGNISAHDTLVHTEDLWRRFGEHPDVAKVLHDLSSSPLLNEERCTSDLFD